MTSSLSPEIAWRVAQQFLPPNEWLRLDDLAPSESDPPAVKDSKPTFVRLLDVVALEVTECVMFDAKVTVVLRNGQTANGWISESLLG